MPSVKEIKLAIAMKDWQRDYEDYLESGKSIKDWCRENNLATSTFSYRLKRLRQEAMLNVNTTNIVNKRNGEIAPLEIAKIELPFTLENTAREIHIKVGNAEIDLSTTIAPEQLRSILEVVCHA